MKTKNVKPFDLQATLKGEPVMLRDGRKAFVRYYESELLVDYGTKMVGYTLRDDGSSLLSSWDVDGRYFGNHLAHLDIIGMWPKARIINGFEAPVPETEAPNKGSWFYVPSLSRPDFVFDRPWQGDENNALMLERGLVFLSKEDAIANAKAMLGINPYEESEE